jgi:hypothetical protein
MKYLTLIFILFSMGCKTKHYLSPHPMAVKIEKGTPCPGVSYEEDTFDWCVHKNAETPLPSNHFVE